MEILSNICCVRLFWSWSLIRRPTARGDSRVVRPFSGRKPRTFFIFKKGKIIIYWKANQPKIIIYGLGAEGCMLRKRVCIYRCCHRLDLIGPWAGPRQSCRLTCSMYSLLARLPEPMARLHVALSDRSRTTRGRRWWAQVCEPLSTHVWSCARARACAFGVAWWDPLRHTRVIVKENDTRFWLYVDLIFCF